MFSDPFCITGSKLECLSNLFVADGMTRRKEYSLKRALYLANFRKFVFLIHFSLP